MPLFTFYAKDGPDGPARRNEHRAGHLANITALSEAGRVAFAGPLKDPGDGRSIGALIVFEAEDLAAARRLMAEDPYVKGGVFNSVEILPVVKAFPGES